MSSCTCGGRPDEIGGAAHRPGCGTEPPPPVDECPDCQQQGRRDGRLLIDGRGIYRCPAGHMWQDADGQPNFKATIPVGGYSGTEHR